MRSKTWTLNAISLCLLPLLTAGCLSDNLLSDHPGTSDKPLEIRMKSYIAGSTSTATRADDGKGMINGGTAFDVKFARVDENAADTDYPTTYDEAAIPGSVNISKELSFAPPRLLSNRQNQRNQTDRLASGRSYLCKFWRYSCCRY